MIYFVRGLDSKLWKVGCASRVIARAATLVSQWREPMLVVAAAPGGFAEEAALHRRFARLRAGVRGREWYCNGDELVGAIHELPESAVDAVLLNPWARSGGKAPLPSTPAAWAAWERQEYLARFASKHNHPPMPRSQDVAGCPGCTKHRAAMRRLFERRSPLLFQNPATRRPYASRLPADLRERGAA